MAPFTSSINKNNKNIIDNTAPNKTYFYTNTDRQLYWEYLHLKTGQNIIATAPSSSSPSPPSSAPLRRDGPAFSYFEIIKSILSY
jgi:hypothetical protein